MSEGPTDLSGPDLTQGVAASELTDGMVLLAHSNGEPVLLARCGEEVFAIGAICTHYSGPLAEGLLVDDTIRCPRHHACFSLRSGEALRAPALNPVASWRVERTAGKIYVREKLGRASRPAPTMSASAPKSVLIIGGGAAGNAAAEMLRREGFPGRITMVTADESVPYDRPNLSKDYLAGNAPEEWIPLRSAQFYSDHGIELKLSTRATAIDTANRHAQIADGSRCAYDALLLATGAEPIRLRVIGGDLPHVHYLRTLSDSRALIHRALTSRRAVVVGASFIGLEVAASLRARNIEVHVVAPETSPMARIMGAEVGDFIRTLHEQHGVVFHLGTTVASIDDRSVTLTSGERLEADVVVVGIGVHPMVSLAAQAGLAIDRGIVVNAYLETSVPGVFAAGDVARWPDRLTGEQIRVEHWVVAERQGQTAARNIVGRRERFDAVPFFWSQHYDVVISYVGHAQAWDKIEFDGRLEEKNCTITYCRRARKLAVATIFRDLESLRAEVELEKAIAGPDSQNSTGSF